MEGPASVQVLVTPAMPSTLRAAAFTDDAVRAATDAPARAFVDEAAGLATRGLAAGATSTPRLKIPLEGPHGTTVVELTPAALANVLLERYCAGGWNAVEEFSTGLAIYYLNVSSLSLKWPLDQRGQPL